MATSYEKFYFLGAPSISYPIGATNLLSVQNLLDYIIPVVSKTLSLSTFSTIMYIPPEIDFMSIIRNSETPPPRSTIVIFKRNL